MNLGKENRPKAYRREVGALSERYTAQFGLRGVWRLYWYPDGDALLESWHGAIRLGLNDPMHPECGEGKLVAQYLEGSDER